MYIYLISEMLDCPQVINDSICFYYSDILITMQNVKGGFHVSSFLSHQ